MSKTQWNHTAANLLAQERKTQAGRSSGSRKLKELEHVNEKLQDEVSKRSSMLCWDSLKK